MIDKWVVGCIKCPPPHSVKAPSGERLWGKGWHGVLCRLKAVWSMPERFKVVCIPCKALYKCSAFYFLSAFFDHYQVILLCDTGVNNLSKVVTQFCPGGNPRLIDRKSNALPLRYCAALVWRRCSSVIWIYMWLNVISTLTALIKRWPVM